MFTGIKNADGTLPLKLHVYPNPVSESATVQFSVTQKDNLSIRVMNMSGKVVYEKQLNAENRGTKTLKIDTDNFANGTYIVSITGNSHKGAAKIIVQK